MLKLELAIATVAIVTFIVGGVGGYLYGDIAVQNLIAENQHMIAEKEAKIVELEADFSAMNSTNQNLQIRISDLELELQKAMNSSVMIETLKGYGNVSIRNMTSKQFAFEPYRVTVRQGDIVIFRVTSTLDLEPRWKYHGIMIEGYNINEVLPKDQIVTMIFRANEIGTFDIHCSVDCGTGHNDMHGQLIVQGA